MGVTSFIVYLWQYYLCRVSSGVTLCTLFMGLYLCNMHQCGLHVLLWSHTDILMRLLAAEPRSTAGHLFTSQWPCGMILLTLHSMVWDWRVFNSRVNVFFIGLLLKPICLQPPSLLIGKVRVPVMLFLCVSYNAECIGEWAGS